MMNLVHFSPVIKRWPFTFLCSLFLSKYVVIQNCTHLTCSIFLYVFVNALPRRRLLSDSSVCSFLSFGKKKTKPKPFLCGKMQVFIM